CGRVHGGLGGRAGVWARADHSGGHGEVCKARREGVSAGEHGHVQEADLAGGGADPDTGTTRCELV
ncbi:hypothetical protein BG005_002509, partial [Podila minutissima]